MTIGLGGEQNALLNTLGATHYRIDERAGIMLIYRPSLATNYHEASEAVRVGRSWILVRDFRARAGAIPTDAQEAL